jgi:hypothetical protein
VVDDLLRANRAKLARLLDLYLSGEYDREALLDHKRRLEDVIGGLERERNALLVTIEAASLTPERIQSIYEFAETARKGLEFAREDFATRRKILELIEVSVTLIV